MPRPKGSKNKVPTRAVEVVDFGVELLLANEKNASLEAQREDLENTIFEQKNQLKSVNKALSSVKKEIDRLESQKAAYKAAQKAEAAHLAVTNKIQELVDGGSSYDDILKMLTK